MNVDRISPRQLQPTAPRKVTFNPVMQVKLFTSSDPINATRSTVHASRLESILKTSPAKKPRVEKKPEKPPPLIPYIETTQKKMGRMMFWCAVGSFALLPAFGPGALVITGICAAICAIYFVQDARIQQEIFNENNTRAVFASSNRSINKQPLTGTRAKDQKGGVNQQRQPARAGNQNRANGGETNRPRTKKPTGAYTANPPRRGPA